MENINSMNVGGQLSMIEDTAAREMEANAYDSTQTYAKEDICIYNDKLYEANTAIATPEAFNIAHWTETTLGKIVQKHRDSITQLTEKNNMIQIDSTGIATLTTKSWTQGDGGASIIIQEDGWYYIESSFMKNPSGNNYDDYLKFQMKLGSNVIISQSVHGLYNMTEITSQTISKFSRGDKVYLNVHVQEAGLKIDTKMIGIRLQSIR